MLTDLLKSGAVGTIEINAQKKIRKAINERWQKLQLVNGLEGHLLETVATLYENQARHIIYEATASDNSGSFETVVFPLIRRVFSKLLANDIVSVQAMNLPIGKLFFIKPVTSEREWNFADATKISDGDTGKHVGLMGYKRTQKNRLYDANGEPEPFDANDERTWNTRNRYYLPDEVVQPTQTDEDTTVPEVTKYMKKTLYDLFYNDFLFDNSKGKVTIRVGSASVVRILPNGDYEDIQPSDIPVSPVDGSISTLMLKVGGFSQYNAGHLIGPDGNEMDTESFLASLKVVTTKDFDDDSEDKKYTTFKQGESIHFNVVTQKYGTPLVDYAPTCNPQGYIYIQLDLTKPVKNQGTTVSGYIGLNPDTQIDPATDFQVAWAEYDSLELETEMGEVSFQLTSETVSVEERKLRATWSPELAQDVSAFHNIDAEAELTAILSEQIAAEIDREILRDIRKYAPWKARWDYSGWQRIGTPSTVYTQKDWNQTLMTKINMISAQIQKSTLRGGADFVVVSAEISAALNDLEYFHVTDASAESQEYNMGIEKIGSINGRYQVIVDPYAPHWSLIMGHHGSSLLDTGYIYAPYIPMALTPTIINPFNMAPVKAISTRYAKKMVNNRYYGAIVCDNLVHWDINLLR